ncbi:MAG: hypothetical protein WCN98_07125 [Verrucomicrobiaceae bacterium]
MRFFLRISSLALIVGISASCSQHYGDGADSNVTKHGTSEVTARLLEVPPKAIVERQLYNYATILKYEVEQVHRGTLKKGDLIYVAHYNPFKPRSEAADKRVKTVGGNVVTFVAGAHHRMALEAPLDEHYMGGIVNEYHAEPNTVLHWAMWTNAADPPTL